MWLWNRLAEPRAGSRRDRSRPRQLPGRLHLSRPAPSSLRGERSRPWPASRNRRHGVLGRPRAMPESPEKAVLERVPNPHPDTHYVARFTAPEFTSLCPVTGQPDFAHLVIDYVPGELAGRIQVAEALPRLVPQPRRLPRGLHGGDRQAHRRRCSSRTTCASAATGIRAAACRSTCSGRRARCPRASGCPTRASRPIAAAADRAALSAHPRHEARAVPGKARRHLAAGEQQRHRIDVSARFARRTS